MSTTISTVKLQVPISKDIRDRLEARARHLGFDSAQAYIRFWAKAEVDGRTVNLGEDDWGQPTDAAAARINQAAEEAKRDYKAGKLKTYRTTDDFMKDLASETNNTSPTI